MEKYSSSWERKHYRRRAIIFRICAMLTLPFLSFTFLDAQTLVLQILLCRIVCSWIACGV